MKSQSYPEEFFVSLDDLESYFFPPPPLSSCFLQESGERGTLYHTCFTKCW